MGNVSMTKCDTCGKMVEDSYSYGWVKVETGFHVALGRDKSGCANLSTFLII